MQGNVVVLAFSAISSGSILQMSQYISAVSEIANLLHIKK